MDENRVENLKPFERNPRKISDDQRRILGKGLQKYGDLGGIVFNVRNQQLVGGNQRSSLFAPEDQIVYVEKFDQPDEQGTLAHGFVVHDGKKYAYREVDFCNEDHLAASLLANKAGGEWDWPALGEIATELHQIENFDMELTGFMPIELEPIIHLPEDIAPLLPGEDAPPEKYTMKIQAPIYEIKGNRPDVSDLVDTAKTEALLREIESSNHPDPIKRFLSLAAYRHSVFNYELIAEYYAHASPELQDLCEKSALVIIDFHKAIENGFVKMTKEIAEAYVENP